MKTNPLDSIRNFIKNRDAFAVDNVIGVGIIFASLMVMAFIIYTISDQLITPTTSATVNSTIGNITAGFDSAIALLLVAVTVMILGIMLSYMFIFRQKR